MEQIKYYEKKTFFLQFIKGISEYIENCLN